MDKFISFITRSAKSSKQSTTSAINKPSASGPPAGPFGTPTKNIQELTPQEVAAEMILMLGNDGTVSGLFNMINSLIAGVEWGLTPADETPEAVKQADEITHLLTKNAHQGGMSSPFRLFIAQCALAPLTGFSPFEKVYRVDEETGLIGYKKLSWMDPSTVTILMTPDGSFNGFHQEFESDDIKIDTKLPPEACYLYSFDQELGGLYGRSAFTSAYGYHKRKLKTLDLLADKNVKDAQLMKVVQERENATIDQADLQTTVRAVDTGSSNYRSTIGISKHFDVSTLAGSSSSMLLETISDCNSEIVRSVLGQVITLGGGSTGGGSGSGSFALSKEQFQILTQYVEGIKEVLSHSINTYVISPLFTINYPNPLYATFSLDVVDNRVAENNFKLFLELIKKDKVPPTDLDALLAEGFRISKIERPEPDPEADGNEPDEPDQPEPPVEAKVKKKFNNYLAQTPTEFKPNPEQVDKWIRQSEDEVEKTVKDFWLDSKAQIVADIEEYLAANREEIDYRVDDTDLLNELTAVGLAIFLANFARVNKALGTKPQASTKSINQIKRLVKQAVDKQIVDVSFAINNNYNTTDISKPGPIVKKTRGIINKASTTTAGATAAMMGPELVARGRRESFNRNKRVIDRYVWQAVLDAATTDRCLSLHGTVITAEDLPRAPNPPLHGRCRCSWEPVAKTVEDKPPITRRYKRND